MTIPTLSIVELRDNLRRALCWLRSVGVRAEPTRLAQYRTRLEEMVGARAAGKGLTRASKAYWAALHEAAEICRIVEGAQRLELSDELTQRLAQLRDGPYFAVDEWTDAGRRKNHRPRDIGFELVCAGLLVGAEVDTRLPRIGDLECRIAGQHILVECKRVASLETFDERVEEAFRQIGSRRGRHPGALGLTFIDVTPYFNESTHAWEVPDEATLRKGLDTFMERVRTYARSKWPRGHFGPHSLGLFFRFSAVVVLREPGLDALYHHWSFDTHLAVRPELGAVVRALAAGIRSRIPDEQFRLVVQ